MPLFSNILQYHFFKFSVQASQPQVLASSPLSNVPVTFALSDWTLTDWIWSVLILVTMGSVTRTESLSGKKLRILRLLKAQMKSFTMNFLLLIYFRMVGGSNPPIICGANDGQHMILDAGKFFFNACTKNGFLNCAQWTFQSSGKSKFCFSDIFSIYKVMDQQQFVDLMPV